VAWVWITRRIDAVAQQQHRELRELSHLEESPEAADEEAHADVERWVERHLPGWLDLLDDHDRDLLVRRYGPEQVSYDRLACERGVSVSSIRRVERIALRRAQNLLLAEWATMAG